VKWGSRLALIVLVLLPLVVIIAYRFISPPVTPLMLIRSAEGEGLDYRWRPLDQISSALPAAAIAAEDNLFCSHFGLDLGAIRAAWQTYRSGGVLRGASTISQQTAKNLFLWPGRHWLRKALEAYLALMLEAVWPKRRILEVYLNIAEFDGGVYGAEAASQRYFRRTAAQLTKRQAALLAAILPNPRQRSAAQPSRGVLSNAQVIEKRIGQLGPLLACY